MYGAKITCAMYWKTAILNALLLTLFTASPHLRRQFKATLYFMPKDGLLGPDRSCLPTQAINLKAVEKAIVDKGLHKCSQYSIFMIASDAASSFVLFHATQSLELLQWCCHMYMQGCFILTQCDVEFLLQRARDGCTQCSSKPQVSFLNVPRSHQGFYGCHSMADIKVLVVW